MISCVSCEALEEQLIFLVTVVLFLLFHLGEEEASLQAQAASIAAHNGAENTA